MFERFTDRARRVVVLAQEEARLLNHNYIGTEHILLGLIREGEGVAAQVLQQLGCPWGCDQHDQDKRQPATVKHRHQSTHPRSANTRPNTPRKCTAITKAPSRSSSKPRCARRLSCACAVLASSLNSLA